MINQLFAVDIRGGGESHNVLRSPLEGVGEHVLVAARRGDFEAMHAAVPCETWSVSLDEEHMLRDVDNVMGKPGLSAAQSAKVWAANACLYYTLDVARAVHRPDGGGRHAGGQVTIENPAPRCVLELKHLYWAEKARHASLFISEPVLACVSV